MVLVMVELLLNLDNLADQEAQAVQVALVAPAVPALQEDQEDLVVVNHLPPLQLMQSASLPHVEFVVLQNLPFHCRLPR
jgi:hypothetical protein